MLKRILFLVILLFLFFTALPLAEARVYLDINAPTLVQIPIILPKWRRLNRLLDFCRW